MQSGPAEWKWSSLSDKCELEGLGDAFDDNDTRSGARCTLDTKNDRSTARATAVIAAALLLSAAVTAGGVSVPPPFPNACSQFGCDARHTGRTTMLGPGTLAAPKPIPGFLPADHSDDMYIPPLTVPPVLAPSGSLLLDCRMDPMTGNATGYGVCLCFVSLWYFHYHLHCQFAKQIC
jgi:hypothetical protein